MADQAGNPVGNVVGNTAGNVVGNTIGNTIGNTASHPSVHGIATAPHRAGIGWLDIAIGCACAAALAVVALPRQRATVAQTQGTEVTALARSVASAAEFGHRLWSAQGGSELATPQGRVGIVNGYPAAGDLAKLLEPGEAMAFEHEGGTFRRQGTADDGCAVVYAPPARAGGSAVVEQQTDGC